MDQGRGSADIPNNSSHSKQFQMVKFEKEENTYYQIMLNYYYRGNVAFDVLLRKADTTWVYMLGPIF